MPRTLQPVMFIPGDQAATLRPEFSDGLWRALGEAMRWWRNCMECDVFQTLPIVEFVGAKPAQHYFQGTQEKVAAELGRLYTLGRDGKTYVCYGLWGEGPYQARGNVIGASGDYLVVQSSTSLVMFADDHFPGYDPALAWNSRLAQTGALAHELGHTLGLGHTDEREPSRASESIMYAWWQFPRLGLTERELQAALANLER
jgi:hypothetical protein